MIRKNNTMAPPPVVPTSNMRMPRMPSKPVNNYRPTPGQFGSGDPKYDPNAQQTTQQDATGAGVPSTAPAPAAYDPNNPNQGDQAAQQAIYELISQGPRDTSKDEALVNQMMQSAVGQGQGDLNARLGAGGFGTSGALGAMGADMRSQAALKAAQQDMGLRKDARDEWLNRVMAGMEGEFKDRGMDMSEEQYDNYWETLMAMQGAKPGTDQNTQDKNPNTPDQGQASAGASNEGLGGDVPKHVGEHRKPMTDDPNGYELHNGVSLFDDYVGSDDQYDYWKSPFDGKKFKTKKTGA